MSQRAWMVVILILAIGLGAGALWIAGRGDIEPRLITTAVRPTGAGHPAGMRSQGAGREALPAPEAVSPEAERSPQPSEDLDRKPDDHAEAIPFEVEYPRLEKLVSSSLSEVPHQVLGAWDEDHASSKPGLRRAFVLVVEPGLSESELETLARDIRERHGDAVILDVSIYDSERAATHPRAFDGGALSFRHLVAEVKKNDRIPLDVIRVRGRRIEP